MCYDRENAALEWDDYCPIDSNLIFEPGQSETVVEITIN